jgi:hypothetical protein
VAFDVEEYDYKVFGVNLMRVTGISGGSLLKLTGERFIGETVSPDTHDSQFTGETVCRDTHDSQFTGETVSPDTHDSQFTGETVSRDTHDSHFAGRNSLPGHSRQPIIFN